jgi:hypothetical protein
MFDKKLTNELTSYFLWNWRKLSLKRSICYVRHMEKTPYQELDVFECHRRFSEQSCGKWPDCPLMMRTDEHVGKMGTLVRTDHRLGIRMIAEELNLDKEMRDKFNMKKVCVPKWSQRIWVKMRSWQGSKFVLKFWRKLKKIKIFWTLWSPATKLGLSSMTQKWRYIHGVENSCIS